MIENRVRRCEGTVQLKSLTNPGLPLPQAEIKHHGRRSNQDRRELARRVTSLHLLQKAREETSNNATLTLVVRSCLRIACVRAAIPTAKGTGNQDDVHAFGLQRQS